MTKVVELENLLAEFAWELTDEEMVEIEEYYDDRTIVAELREARK